jgi:hypothetical protein
MIVLYLYRALFGTNNLVCTMERVMIDELHPGENYFRVPMFRVCSIYFYFT